jgi:hypothetical protein
MEIGACNIDFAESFITDFYARFIFGFIKNSSNRQAGGGRGCSNQGNHKRFIRKRDALPILGDKSKQPMLDFVPFACSRRVM